jgi:hypothetical protein
MPDQPSFTRGLVLGYAQGHAIGGGVAAIISAALGMWLLAGIFVLSAVFGLLLWRRERYQAHRYRNTHGLKSYNADVAAALAARKAQR